MSRLGTTSRTAISAVLAIACATAFAAPADAKKSHRRHGHHRHHKVIKKAKKKATKVTASVQTTVVACPGANDLPTAATAAAAQASTLCLVNNERIKAGLPPVAGNASLDLAAAVHNTDMVVAHYFEHSSPAGSTMVARLAGVGYATPMQGWTAGENIGWGTGTLGTPEGIVRSWMNSPGHRDNILEPRFREAGTSVIASPPFAGISQPSATYTQDFGAHI